MGFSALVKIIQNFDPERIFITVTAPSESPCGLEKAVPFAYRPNVDLTGCDLDILKNEREGEIEWLPPHLIFVNFLIWKAVVNGSSALGGKTGVN